MKIYFDNASVYTTSQEIKNHLLRKISGFYADSKQQHFLSLKSKAQIEESRLLLSNLIKLKPQNILFISGVNDIILLISKLFETFEFKAIITSVHEEEIILNTYKKISQKYNIPLLFVKQTEDTTIDLEHLKKLLKNNQNSFVSLSHVNRLTGRFLQLSRVAKFVHQNKGIFHCNMSNSVCKYEIYPEDLDIDIVSAKSEHFNGIRNAGFVYLKDSLLTKIFRNPYFAQNNDPALISTMCFSIKTNLENINKNFNYVNSLQTSLFNELNNSGIKFNPSYFEKHHFSPYIVNLELPEVQNIDNLVIKLDLNDIYISNSRLLHPAFNKNIRISFSESNNEEEIKRFVRVLKKIFL